MAEKQYPAIWRLTKEIPKQIRLWVTTWCPAICYSLLSADLWHSPQFQVYFFNSSPLVSTCIFCSKDEPNRTISDLNYKDAKVLRQYLPSNITCMHWCLWVSENGRRTYWKQLWSSSHTTVCILFPDHINPTSLYQWLSFCVEVLETLLQKKGEFVSYFLFSSLPFVQCLTPCMSLWGIWQRWLYWHCSFSQSSDLSLFKTMILEHWGNTLSMFFLNCNQSDQHILGNLAIYNCMKMGCCKWCQGVYRFTQLVSDISEKWIDLSNVQLYHSKICRHYCIGVLRVCKPHYAW